MVGGVDELHDLVLSSTVIEHVHLGHVAIDQAIGNLCQRVVERIERCGLGGRATVKVLAAHVERTRDKVAPAVGQVGVVDLLHAVEADGAVGTGDDVGHEVVAIALDAQHVDNVLRSDGVAAALGHLLGLASLGIAHGQEAVGKDVLGQGLANGHEHGGPNDAVKADDVLTHDVELRGPAIGQLGTRLVGVDTVADGRHIVEQRIEPHVGHVTLVKRDLDAPVKARTAHGKVIKAALDKAAYLIHTERRLDKVGVLVIELEQLVLEGGKLKEVGLLLHALKRTVAVGAQVLADAAVLLVALLDLRIGEVGLVRHAIPTVVAALIQVAGLLHALPQVLHGMMLARLGGADEVVVGDLELAPKLLEVRSLAVGPLLRRHVVLGCGLGDLLAVLVHAGQELDVIAGGATITGLNVGDDGGISRAQVRIGVDVVDGRRDKERRLALIHGVCPPEKRCIQGMILAQGLDILHLLHIEHHGIDIALAARILLRQAPGHRRGGLPLLERGADILAQGLVGIRCRGANRHDTGLLILARRRDDQRNLALYLAASTQLLGKLSSGPAQDLLVQLGEFAADGNLTLGKDLRHGLERRHDAMWRLVEDERAGHHGKALQTAHAVAVLSTQKALEEKMLAGNARRNERRDASRGPGNNFDGHIGLTRRLDQRLAGIGHTRHASVRGKSEGLPRQQTVDQAGGAAGDHILVATDKRLGNAQVHQQL